MGALSRRARLIATTSAWLLSLPTASSNCNNDCPYTGDGWCDDGGPGSEYDQCLVAGYPMGSDCDDCGARHPSPPPAPSEPPPWPPPSPPPCCLDGAACRDPLTWQRASSSSDAHAGAFAPWTEKTLSTQQCTDSYGPSGAHCAADASSCCEPMCGACAESPAHAAVDVAADECFVRPDASDYRGTIARTVTARACVSWATVAGYTAADYPLAGLGDHNFCRMPARYPSRPTDVCNCVDSFGEYGAALGCTCDDWAHYPAPYCMTTAGAFEQCGGALDSCARTSEESPSSTAQLHRTWMALHRSHPSGQGRASLRALESPSLLPLTAAPARGRAASCVAVLTIPAKGAPAAARAAAATTTRTAAPAPTSPTAPARSQSGRTRARRHPRRATSSVPPRAARLPHSVRAASA